MYYKTLLVFTFVVLLSSCESSIDPPKSKPVKEAVIEFRLGHDMPVDSAQHRAALRLAESVKDKTNGKLQITVYPDQTLGSDREMIAMAQSGDLDIILPPTAKLSHIIPNMQIFDLPFLFPDRKTAYEALDGDIGKKLLMTAGSQGLVGLAFWESGFKQLTSNKPIKNKSDFIGQKFRIMESTVIRDQFHAWGAETITVDFGKTYDALKNGVADGQENPLTSILGKNFQEVQKYLVMSNHGYLAQMLAISKLSFEKLNQSHRQAIYEAVIDSTKFQRVESEKIHNTLYEKIHLQNIKISELNSETRGFLLSKSRMLLEKYRMSFGSAHIERLIQQREQGKVFSADQLVIALDADMSGNSAMSGLAIRRGIELALEEINLRGGLLGKEVVLSVRDNSMVPARGLDNLKHFTQIPNVIAVFGGISSPVVLSELEFIHQNQLLFLVPWAAATPIVDNGFEPNFVFRLSVRDEYAAKFLLEEALKVSKNVGLLLVNNPWGRSNYKALTAALSEKGYDEIQTEWFDWGEKSFEKRIQRFQEKKVKAIIYVGNPVEGSLFIHDLAKLSTPPAVISHWGITGSEFSKMAASSLKKIDLRVLQTFSFIDNTSPKARDIAKRYHEKYFTTLDREIVAPVGTAHAYDLTLLLAQAISKVNSTDSDRVRAQLENTDSFDGIVKTYNPPFSKNNHDALNRDDFIFSQYRDGYLYPVGKVNEK